MGIQEYRATGGNKALLKEYHRKSDSLAKWQINFSKYDAQTYAFDRLGSGDHGIFATDEYYPKSGSYDFRYKSVECGKTDRIVVDFGSYSEKDSVIFKDKYGVTLKVVDKNILTFTGVSNADTNFIYAYRGDKKIGKLFLNTYQRKTYKVVLVSVNDATLPNTSTLADYLNKVYRQCVDSFEITTDKIKIDDLKSFSHGGSGVLTVYNDDQKKVLKAYDSKMQDNTYYLFFVDGVTDKKDGSGTLVSGYMPRGYNCGFIYDGGSERTIAHELGHGIAGLEHVFENSNNSGKTKNLMDYSIPETATELWHFQWDQIQDPSRVWMKWSKDESEGEWTTDGHYYLFTYLGMLMGMNYADAERLGRYAEEPDTYVISNDDFSERDVTLPNGERRHLKAGQVIMGEDEVVSIPEGYNIGDMLENTTWLLGGYQQRNHALTGGFHGVELAATTYAIKYRNELGLQSDYEHYLIHRFGDVFAHFDIMNDATASIDNFINESFQFVSVGDEVELSDGKIIKMSAEQIIPNGDRRYITTYSRDHIYFYVRNQILPSNGEIGSNNDIIENIKHYITPNGMSDDVKYFDDAKLIGYVAAIEKYINIDFEFIQNGDLLREMKEYEEPIDKYVEFVNNEVLREVWNGVVQIRATGKPQIYSKSEKTGKYRTTFDKLGLKRCIINCVLQAKDIDGAYVNTVREDILKRLPSATQNRYRMYGDDVNCMAFTFGHLRDDGLPDNILRRPKLYMAYVKRCAELINIIRGSEDSEKTKKAIDQFQKIIDWGVSQYATDPDVKLDGVFAFLISLKRAEITNNSRFSVPIKLLPPEISGLATKANLYYNHHLPPNALEDATRAQINVLRSFIETCTDLLDRKYEIIPIMQTESRVIFEFIKR